MGCAGLWAAFIGLVVAALLVATVTAGEAALPIGSRPPAHFVGPAGVGAAHPEHALLLGDSLALTLGIGLSNHSLDWGIAIDNQGRGGLRPRPADDGQRDGNGVGGRPGLSAVAPHLDAAGRAGTQPDLVVVLLGRWESLDRLYDGQLDARRGTCV